MAKKKSVHYVDNKKFLVAMVDYRLKCQKAEDKKRKRPVVTNYIATCFLKIAEGLSHKSNFIRYTYREEMVMDAVENCLKAIENYNLEAATRTGRPNAFAYFTQVNEQLWSWLCPCNARASTQKARANLFASCSNSSGVKSLPRGESADVIASFSSSCQGS